jgi:tetratricopeptide (TPR) repeat protein
MSHIPIPLPVQPPRERLAPATPAENLANRASALYHACRCDEALDLAYQAVAIERTMHTLNNLAAILEVFGRFDEGFRYATEAYNLAPGDNRIRKLYSEHLLRFGHFAQGWPIFNLAHRRLEWLDATLPRWEGQFLCGKRLLVFTAGGYGDNLYFLRWLLQLQARGAQVTYLTAPSLAPLSRALNIPTVENWNGNFTLRFSDFDYYTEIHEIPQRIGMSIDAPALAPYIKIPPRPRFHLRRRIGFRWRAGSSAPPPRFRSLNWLQRQRITSRLPGYIDLSDLFDFSGSWLDTARVVASLDLLITVDTGVAHLAGILGVPTWVVLPGASAWHYPLGYDTHPLYPTMRIFWSHGEGLDLAVDSLVEEL